MGDFIWTEESLRWLHDAAEQSGYYEALAARLAPWLRPGDRVLELGCGTGALAVALSPHVQSVTALDSSARALSALTERPANVFPVCADAFSYVPDAPFDALLLCYFARPDEFIALSRLCRGTVLLLCDTRRSKAYRQALRTSGVPFAAERFSLAFDQPLRSEEAALAYAVHYGRPSARFTGDADFPYRDEITRDITLLRYPAGGNE